MTEGKVANEQGTAPAAGLIVKVLGLMWDLIDHSTHLDTCSVQPPETKP